MTGNVIKEQLKQLPLKPGVYLMKDSAGNIIYVGKAARLRQRVRSYFSSPGMLPPKQQQMVSLVDDLEFYITGSEQEALILENNLIKQHYPHFNVRLKDDKTMPYIKIDFNEDWPRVKFTRRLEDDGGRYFGPFTSARSVRQTLRLLKKIFPYRTCKKTITGKDTRPCLQYHINQCVAPCIGGVSREDYDEILKQVVLFLEGKQDSVIQQLEKKMAAAADALEFEKAAVIRNQIQSINDVIEGQRVAATTSGEQDVIAFADNKDESYVQVFFVRNDKLIGRESFGLKGTSAEEPSQIMSSFIKQYYSSATYIPPLLLLQHPVEDREVIEEWLKSKRGSRVHIRVPARGNKKQLVRIVAENAERGMQLMKIKQLSSSIDLAAALDEIQKELGLPATPVRMEGYDISNIQGKEAVGSMVVFEKGKAKPAHYRRFKIRTVPGADDYAMLQEVLRRRFKHNNSHDNRKTETDTWAVMPDLILIDGGKGQLNSVLAVMKEIGLESVPVAGLAKENEEIFIPGRKDPIILPGSSVALQLLQRLRDEAHRFALGYHQKVRTKKTFSSSLDSITGIGPKRKRALLKQFGSVRAIREASEEELTAARGITPGLAKSIKELA